MSSDIYFYIVKGLTKEEAKSIPSVVLEKDLDESGFSYNEYHSEPFSWEEEIGTKKTMKYTSVNRFKAASEMYGKKATSMSSRGWNSPHQYTVVRFEDGSETTIDDSEFEKYQEEKEREVYLYHKEQIADVPEYQIKVGKEYQDRLLDPESMLQLAEEYFDANDGDVRNGRSYYDEFSPIEAIMTTYFKAKKQDAKIVINID